MSEWNFEENQLKQWIPRSTSPQLKKRIFDCSRAEEGQAKSATEMPKQFWGASAVQPRAISLYQWLAPALGMAVVFMLAVRQADLGPERIVSDQFSRNMTGMKHGTAGWDYMESSVDRTMLNHLPPVIFESTNVKASSFSIASFLLLNTNGLKR